MEGCEKGMGVHPLLTHKAKAKEVQRIKLKERDYVMRQMYRDLR